MGYSCPVCGDPQADDIHLANHLGFTAITRGGDHEAWLDDHVPDWGEMDDEELSTAVTDHAEETEYPQVFEDTTSGHDHAHEHGHEHDRGGTTLPPGAEGMIPDDGLDEEAREILAEAREMTRQRREQAEANGDPEAAAENRSEQGEDSDESQ